MIFFGVYLSEWNEDHEVMQEEQSPSYYFSTRKLAEEFVAKATEINPPCGNGMSIYEFSMDDARAEDKIIPYEPYIPPALPEDPDGILTPEQYLELQNIRDKNYIPTKEDLKCNELHRDNDVSPSYSIDGKAYYYTPTYKAPLPTLNQKQEYLNSLKGKEK